MSHSEGAAWLKKFARWITHVTVEFPIRVLLIGLVITGVGGYYTALLFMNLRPDIEELLPETAPSVMGLAEIRSRLRATDSILLLFQSPDKKPVPRIVADEMAEALGKIPKNVAASIEYKIANELEFFNKRRLLYMEVEDLTLVREYVRQKIDYEINLYNPLNIFSGEELTEPRIDIKEIEKKYAGQTEGFTRMPEGYYATPDETIRAIIVYMPTGGNGMTSAYALRKEIDRVLAEVNPAKHMPGLKVNFAGAGQDMIEEFDALVKDVGIATTVVMLLTIGVVIGFFRSWRGTVALLLALTVGTAVCFGLSFFLVGYMNANSAFMGSIVIGNGINVGIMCLARYYEERRKRATHREALEVMIMTTTVATFTAALAAGLAYGSLMATSFRGFSQFGVIGFTGMVACWVCTMIFLPMFLTLLYGKNNPHPDFDKQPKRPIMKWLGTLIDRYPHWITLASLAVTIALGVVAGTYRGEILETDLTKLRDKESMERGSGFHANTAKLIFGQSLSPLVVMAYSQDEARRITARIRERIKRDGAKSLASDVKNIDDFLPKNQAQKMRVIDAINRLLTRQVKRALSPQDKALVETVLGKEAFQAISQADLPKLIIDKFTEKSGAVGNLVLIYPAADSLTWKGDQLLKFVADIREDARAVSPKAPVAGQHAVSSDLIGSIWADGPRATAMAFGAVIVLVFFIFRNIKASLLVLSSLVLGVLWQAAMIALFRVKINFMNFIALPITFGIGVDYGVNIFERLKQDGAGKITDVIESTGGAVFLASLTTIIGYASLLLAGNMAFVSFGQIAILGEVTCVAAAVITVPSMMVWFARARGRK
jgi:predicted RND superfamily exporter protein